MNLPWVNPVTTYAAEWMAREQLKFETAMKKQREGEPEESRALFVKYLTPPDLIQELMRDTTKRDQLIEDVVDICVGMSKKWEINLDDLFKALRGSRWRPYTPRSGRDWRIPVGIENEVIRLLRDWGFKTSGVPRVTHFKERFIQPTDKLKFTVPKETIQAAQKKAAARLDVPLDIEPDELLEMLRTEKDQMKKKSIRAKLRRLGHKGGLRG